MTTPLLINSELVAMLWLAGVPGVPSDKIGKRLPKDPAAWAATGFVQVVTVVGGDTVPVARLRQPVVQVDTWACNLTSGKPPFERAASLAETILRACEAEDVGRPVTRSGYETVQVKNVVAMGDIQEDDGDPSGYAHYILNLQFFWSDLN